MNIVSEFEDGVRAFFWTIEFSIDQAFAIINPIQQTFAAFAVLCVVILFVSLAISYRRHDGMFPYIFILIGFDQAIRFAQLSWWSAYRWLGEPAWLGHHWFGQSFPILTSVFALCMLWVGREHIRYRFKQLLKLVRLQ